MESPPQFVIFASFCSPKFNARQSDTDVLADVKERIIGSPDLYASLGRGIKASVNFVTAHDGFTLMDLVSYNSKHNEANGEGNRDGENHNNSWNCGWLARKLS